MPAKAENTGLRVAVASGDRRQALEALRDRLAAEIEKSTGSAVAALAKQLGDVLTQIATMPVAKEKSPVDDLAKRRAARRKATASPTPKRAPVKRRAGGSRTSS